MTIQKILLVDDSKTELHHLSEILLKRGYVVRTAENGEEARIGTQMNCSLACDDVEATYRQLSGRGVEFEGPPQKQAWGTYVIMKDSEGNRFVVGSD